MELTDLTPAHLGARVRATYMFGDTQYTVEGPLTHYSHELHVVGKKNTAWGLHARASEDVYTGTSVEIGAEAFTPETLELIAPDITSWDQVDHGDVVEYEGYTGTLYKIGGGSIHLALHRMRNDGVCMYQFTDNPANRTTAEFEPPAGIKRVGSHE